MLHKLIHFTKSTYFSNAIKITLASVIPVFVFSNLGSLNIGLTIAIGAFLTYPSDIPSNFKNKFQGILGSCIIISGVNLLINILAPIPYLLYPVLSFLIFFLSMISVFGQRASMISFSALLSTAITFSSLNTGVAIYYYAGLLFLGGIFYLLISMLFYFINPYRYTELQIASCMKLTSNYLKFRGDLWNVDADRKSIIKQQLALQVELNTIYQNIRKLISGNQNKSTTSDENRKTLIVFISLVEILELGLSTAFDHKTFHLNFDSHPKLLLTYQNIAYQLANTLDQIAESLIHQDKYITSHSLLKDLNNFNESIENYKNILNIEVLEGTIMLTTMLEYAQKQVEKITVIENALDIKTLNEAWKTKDKNLNKILITNYYSISTLLENCSFNSTIFRHSLRLTVSILLAFVTAYFFPIQNINIILLTIVVILRPGFGLTKKRSFQRTIGTLIGAAIAYVMIILDPNVIFKSIATVLLMILGFSFSQINFKISAIFITIYIILVFSLFQPNILNLIEFRIIDTLIGVFITLIANFFFWPSWEFLKTPIYVEKSIKANRDYIQEIASIYNTKENANFSYRVARKNAFIEIGNLMASYQRMSEEPLSKQKSVPEVFQLAMLNHTLLSSSASMGTYIQSHTTTAASEVFNTAIQLILNNLDQAILLLKEKNNIPINGISHDELEKSVTDLINIKSYELKLQKKTNKKEISLKTQEAQLITEQLIWLTNISKNIFNTTKTLMATK